MADLSWRSALLSFLESRPEKGRFHYADLTAALPPPSPPPFAPAPGRVTPHFTAWRTLNESEEFESLGGGWFRLRAWGDTGEHRLRLSSDGGSALRAASAALRAGTGGQAIEVLLGDPTNAAREAALREAAIADARAHLVAEPLTAATLAEVLRSWSASGSFADGRIVYNRFAPAFVGAYQNRYRDHLSTVNDWVGSLRAATPDEVPSVLDALWARNDLPLAGTIFPSMVLHTLDPGRWFPWTGALARGLAACGIGDGQADGSGEGYLRYCAGVRQVLEREGLSPHLADMLLTREGLAASAKGDGPTVAPTTAFGRDGLALLGRIRDTPGADAAWFDTYRAVYQAELRQPLVALVERVLREVIRPVVNSPALLGDDPMVEDPRRLIGNINARMPRANGSIYYPFLWAAFFPTSHERRQSAAQLFVSVHAEGVDVGVSLDRAPAEVQARFIQRLRSHRARLDAWLRTSGTSLVRRRYDVSGGPVAQVTPVTDAAALHGVASADESVVVRLPPDEACAPDGLSRAEAAFRSVLPLWVTALARDLDGALDALGVPAATPDDEADERTSVLSDSESIPTLDAAPGYSLEQLHADTHLAKAWLADVVRAARFDPADRSAVGQVVLYGPPGTGKTWVAERIARHLTDGDESRVEIVQLHPAFAYEHFLEGYRPKEVGGNLVFHLEDGVVPRLVQRVRATGKVHVLVLDEMNRGDLPQIMGELLYLLSRRGKGTEVRLARSGRGLSLPDKLVIVGTMNTADRSIAHVDFALRRRFRFFRVDPESSVIAAQGGAVAPDFATALAGLLDSVNGRLTEVGGLLLGHSYLLGVRDEAALREVWEREILPTLEDSLDFETQRLRPFSWEATLATFRDLRAAVRREGESEAP
ncbi:MAG: AAA family ATPase [Myxococcota bacterium]